MLEKSLQANTANFQRLQTDLDKHLFCEEREVSEESNNNNEEEGDEVGKDEEVVEYRETFFVAQKQWEHLTAGVASFPQEVKPWQEMVDLQSSLEDWYNKLSEKLENGRKELTRLQQRGDNPAVIVERSKVSYFLYNLSCDGAVEFALCVYRGVLYLLPYDGVTLQVC